MALTAILGGASILSQGLGGEAARDATGQGAQTALNINRKGLSFADEILQGAIERQQPFIDAGQAALPLATQAAQGGEGFRDTPIFRQREETGLAALMDAIQGDELSGFAGDRFGATLASSEEAQNRNRLNDLLSIGLGASGAAGQSGATLANLASQNAIQGGNIAGSGAQTSFEQRQNAVNQSLQSLGGLPSFLAATNQPNTSLAGPQAGSSQGLFFGASR